jgi:hypothetical protein
MTLPRSTANMPILFPRLIFALLVLLQPPTPAVPLANDARQDPGEGYDRPGEILATNMSTCSCFAVAGPLENLWLFVCRVTPPLSLPLGAMACDCASSLASDCEISTILASQEPIAPPCLG